MPVCNGLCLLQRNKTLIFIHKKLQKDLINLTKWESMIGISNSIHTQMFCNVTNTHARRMTRFNYTPGDKSLHETDSHPFLGVLSILLKSSHESNTSIKLLSHVTLPLYSYKTQSNLHSCPQHIKELIDC